MKIHTKTLLIFFLAISLLFTAALILTTQILLSQYERLEGDLMLQKVERFHLDLQAHLKPVASAAGELAASDDLYRFLGGQNPGLLNTSLSAPTLSNLGLNFISIWDDAGRLVAGQYLDDGSNSVRPLPPELVDILRSSVPSTIMIPSAAASKNVR